MEELRIANIVMSGKLDLIRKISDDELKILFNTGWRIVNENKNPQLIKKFGNSTVCLNFTGSTLIQSLKDEKVGHEIFQELKSIFEDIFNTTK